MAGAIAAASPTEWAILLGAVGVFVTACAGAFVSIVTVLNLRPKVDRIDEGVKQSVHELRTLNGSTVGQLADAGETRRIEQIEPTDRTSDEAQHIEVVPPPPGTPGGEA